MDKPYNLEKISSYVGGAPGQLKEMIALFLSTTPQELGSLTEAIAQENWTETYALAHRIKPSIDVLDVKPVKSLIREVEALAKSKKDCHKIPELMKTINEIMDEVFRLMALEKI